LSDILRYTGRQWGASQRKVYQAKLTATMGDLRRFPFRGQPREQFSPGLRAMPVGAHVVYYRVSDDEVTVLRVLHGSMDAAAQFND